MKTHILYIPGLGDGYDPYRAKSLKGWKKLGVTSKLVPMTWYDGQNMDQKMELIANSIKMIPAEDKIVLIGESAGATLALHTANRDKRVDAVITLCGVTRPNTPIAGYLRKKAPALDEAVNTLPESFDIPVHSVRAANDSVVGKKYSVVKGAKEHVVWSVGHFITIALCLNIYAFKLAAIAKEA